MYWTRGRIPGIAASSREDFISLFTPVISADKDVLFISISSELTSSYNHAVTAAAYFPAGRVQVVDSLSVSAGSGTESVMCSVRAARKGLQTMDIATLQQRFREDVEFNVLMDSNSSVNKAGSVYGMQNKIKSLFNLRQQATVKTGSLQRVVRYSGKQANNLGLILQNVVDNQNHMDPSLLIIAQTMAEQQAEYLRERLSELTCIRNIIITPGICSLICQTNPRSWQSVI
jgi:fatty acid-binding protein DegV